MKIFPIFILASQFYFSQDKGKIAYDNDDFQKSYDYYLNILDKRENDVSAKYGAGVSAYKIQDLQNAINFLKEASTAKDKILSSKAHYNLANIYKDENRIEESFSNYKKAIELNPKDLDACMKVLKGLIKIENLDMAKLIDHEIESIAIKTKKNPIIV